MIDQAIEYNFGDPRRCSRHPDVKTSSDDGMFDAPCGKCEFEMEEHYGANDRHEQSEEGTETPLPEDDHMGYDTTRERDIDRMDDGEDVPF